MFKDSAGTGMMIGILMLVGIGILGAGWVRRGQDLSEHLKEAKEDLAELRVRRERLEGEIRTLQAREKLSSKEREEDGEAGRSDLERRLEALKGRIRQLEAEKRATAERVGKIEEEIGTERERYRKVIRMKAVGEDYEAIELQDGRRFEGVKLRVVDGEGIEFSHRHGVMRARPGDLPVEWRKRFDW